MKYPGYPDNEQERLERLRELAILDTNPDEEFERITRLAAELFQVPICLVSLVDDKRQWFKSHYGLVTESTARDISFCAHVVESGQDLIVCDTRQEADFADNPLVTAGPGIRFYAGVPLTDQNRYTLGTLCLIDRQARSFSSQELGKLHALADVIMDAIHLQHKDSELDAAYRLFSEGPVAVLAFHADKNLRLQHASVNAAELLKLAPGRLKAPDLRFEELFHPEDRPELNTCLESLLLGHFVSRELHVRLLSEDKISRSFFMVLRAEYGSDGIATHIRTYLFDVTQQKQLEASLEGAKQRLKLALEAASLGTWDINLQTGQQVVDERSAAILGLSNTEANSNFDAWLDRIHSADRQRKKTALDEHLTGQTPQYTCEFRLRHKDGHYVWVESHGRVVNRDTHGKPLRIVGTHLDITQRKQDEDVRFRQQRVLSLLSETQQHFLLAHDTRCALQNLLHPLMAITESQFGLIGEARHTPDGEVTLDIPALAYKRGEEHSNQLFGPHPNDYDSELVLNNVDDNALGRVLRTGCTLINNEARALGLELLAPGLIPPLDSFVAIPCSYNEKAIGLIGLGNRSGGFDQSLVQLLQPIIQALGLLVHVREAEAARRHAEEELEKFATIDALTGIANRRIFLQHCIEVLALHRRYGGAFSLALIDIDHFKSINDSYGHQIGDEALKHLTQTIACCLRNSDRLGRIGGEEFGILLPNTNEQDATALCERLRHTVETTPAHHGRLSMQIKISIGLSQIWPEFENMEELMSHADEALYQAKEKGRNRVVCYHPKRADSQIPREYLLSAQSMRRS